MKKAVNLCLCVIAVGFMGIESALAREEVKSPEVVKSPEERRLRVRKIKLDKNFDGVVDRVEIYDEKGVIGKVEVDTTGDGKMNEWIYYKGGKPVKAERDINGDGKRDTWMEYNKKGILIKSETDTNADDKVDEWVTYKDGKPVEARKDTNGDGKIDTWLIY